KNLRKEMIVAPKASFWLVGAARSANIFLIIFYLSAVALVIPGFILDVLFDTYDDVFRLYSHSDEISARLNRYVELFRAVDSTKWSEEELRAGAVLIMFRDSISAAYMFSFLVVALMLPILVRILARSPSGWSHSKSNDDKYRALVDAIRGA